MAQPDLPSVSRLLAMEDVEGIPPWNFSWIIKKELAIMGYPKSPENIKFLLDQGISHLVSLSPEKQPPFELFPNNFKWTPLDVLEFQPPSLDQIITFINICQAALHSGEPVGVHCRMGRGRSGVMAACFLVHFYNQHPQKAVTNVRLTRPGAIETLAQEKAVAKYHDYLRSFDPVEDEDGLQYVRGLPRPTWYWTPRPKRTRAPYNEPPPTPYIF